MYPAVHRRSRPDHPALIMVGSGAALSYAELDDRSTRLAHALRSAGLGVDSTVAVMLENRLEWSDAIWATMRSGMRLAPIARGLSGATLREVLGNCRADAVITSPGLAETVGEVTRELPGIVLAACLDAGAPGFLRYSDLLAAAPATPLDDETLGARITFSSGTTGTPKAVVHPRTAIHPADAPPHLGPYTDLFGFDRNTVYLSPAPIYHTSPFRFTLAIQQLGGTVVCQERFDPETVLAAIERHRVTHAQFVPTMLKRLVDLPDAVRRRYDLSSLEVAITGAASCPPELKDRIDQWWGPVLHELYGASESYGNCHIGPDEARRRRGSVGRALVGTIHILAADDPDGTDVPTGDIGQVWFEGTNPVRYENDPEGNRRAMNARGWATVGDLGRLDSDGYLYLAGRADQLIISGGVNVHPQRAEDWLLAHPLVADAAVIGVPDEDLGERVHAVVVPAPAALADDDFSAELLSGLRRDLSAPQSPRTLQFVQTLPRGENGKLYKRKMVPDPLPAR